GLILTALGERDDGTDRLTEAVEAHRDAVAAYAAGGREALLKYGREKGGAAALLTHAGFAGIWAESYRRQIAIKQALVAGIPRLKDASGLLLRLPERYVAGKAPVFDAHWDITAALSLWTGLKLGADVVRPETRFEPDKIARPNGRTMPRRGLYLLDMAGGTLGKIDDFTGDPSDPSAKPAPIR
ncbi:MAG: hypothetical protein ABL955_15855, partial [Elusimicrobiota bacterium]